MAQAWRQAQQHWRNPLWSLRNPDPAGFWWPAAAVAAQCTGDEAAARAWVSALEAAPGDPTLQSDPGQALKAAVWSEAAARHGDREAIGSLILSMTHSAADVLGVYLIAKHAGLFHDAAGTERCVLPVVPPYLRRMDGLEHVSKALLEAVDLKPVRVAATGRVLATAPLQVSPQASNQPMAAQMLA